MYQFMWFVSTMCFRSDAPLLPVDDGVVMNISEAVLSSWGKSREWYIVFGGDEGDWGCFTLDQKH